MTSGSGGKGRRFPYVAHHNSLRHSLGLAPAVVYFAVFWLDVSCLLAQHLSNAQAAFYAAAVDEFADPLCSQDTPTHRARCRIHYWSMAFINEDYYPGFIFPAPATRFRRGLSNGVPALSFRTIAALTLLLGLEGLKGVAEETNAPAPILAIPQADTNSRETLQAILRIEDQIQSNQIATEQNGREAKEAAARNADLLAKGMKSIEEAFAAQQGALSERNLRELQAMQGFDRVMLVVGGTFTTLASLAILMVVYFQWRTSKVWAEISSDQRGSHKLGNGSSVTAAELAHTRAAEGGAGAHSNSNLLHAMDRLETRVQELEQSTAVPARLQDRDGSPAENGHGSSAQTNGIPGLNQAEVNGQDSITTSLGQGRARMKANDWEAALKCFDEVLALDPSHSEALVKKGAVLERLKKLDEAFACYERAIAADDSMTIAYLHKGGLCSRLERFKEALDCYEKALRTHTESIESS